MTDHALGRLSRISRAPNPFPLLFKRLPRRLFIAFCSISFRLVETVFFNSYLNLILQLLFSFSRFSFSDFILMMTNSEYY